MEIFLLTGHTCRQVFTTLTVKDVCQLLVEHMAAVICPDKETVCLPVCLPAFLPLKQVTVGGYQAHSPPTCPRAGTGFI